ncbi:MAG: hypothetical protein PVH29_05740 [Candidatus Zixiibacteriota bacterium]|jgi:hypothetical protein
MNKLSIIGVVALSLVLITSSFGAQYVLRWDNGVFSGTCHFGKGENTWAGIDYDTSTLEGSSWRLTKVRANLGIGSNERWDGMRLAVFDMAGGKPGKIIWPENGTPKSVIGYGTVNRYVATWCEFPVKFDLPSEKFVVALEQHHDDPLCDNFGLGYGRGFAEQHTWLNYWNSGWDTTGMGVWMLRAVVRSTDDSVEPTSMGRVKALYH